MKSLKGTHEAATARELKPGHSALSSDAELVLAAAKGDKQAFVEIVARHQAMVCGVALGIVGSVAASEDAAQESFLSAWRKIRELREPERLRAWLRQITRNVALGHLRRQRGHAELEDAPDLADKSPAPDEQAASKEEAGLLRYALAQLPEMYREPLVLYYREDQSTRAVAEALDISEDTVRQRLARGREMLRNNLSDTVESILTRTRPTTLFTMTFAVAIGALASPVAIAGSVFAAAEGTTSSASTSGSLFKAVVAKTFLFVAAVISIAFIPVGYHLRARSDSARIIVSTAEKNIQAAPPRSLAAVETSAIFAEWKRLHDTHGTNVAAMPNIYREIAAFTNALYRQGFRAALMAEWVQLNPTNTMAAFRDRVIEANQRRQFIEEWLVRDPAAAVEVFMKGGRTWEATVRNSLPELARRVPERVASVVARLPRPESSRDTQVRDAFAIVAETEIDRARTAAETLTGPNRDQALAGVAQTWAKRDLEGAIAWAKKLPNETDRDEIVRSALVGAATVEPLSALERVSMVPPGGKKGYFASTTGARVLEAAATVDFDSTVHWLAAHPERLANEDLMGLVNAVGEKLNADPSGFLTQYAGSLRAILPAVTNALVKESSGQRRAVWEWLNGQPEDSITTQLRHQLLSTWGEQDIMTAIRLAEDVPATAEGDAQLRLLADGLLGHGAVLHRIDTLLKAAPQRLRQPLVESAFRHLDSETLADPQRWAALLSQLPEPARVRSAEALARAWADQTPAEAINWAASMPAGEARVEAAASIASTWATKDSPAASVWIAGMPAGAERDRSAQSLVFSIAEEFPREAWEWAMSISDAEGRTRAATHAAKMMAARDSVTARAWIENGPFPQETKIAIQSALETTTQIAP
jgi:RNA polymerase sigma factor (sigma-70 family)